MRFTPLTFCLLLIISQQHCDLASPEKIQAGFEKNLRPYFPYSSVSVLPDQHMIIAITCIRGAGPALIKKIADDLSHNPGIDQLKEAPFFGGARYDVIGLGFEDAIIALDVRTKKIAIGSPPDEYGAQYRQQCGF